MPKPHPSFILITHDPVSEAPTDIRHFEFIRYDLQHDKEFFERLDNDLRNVLVTRYESLYDAACEIFRRFKADTHAKVNIAAKQLFMSRVAASWDELKRNSLALLSRLRNI